jgi:hypothetical protein
MSGFEGAEREDYDEREAGVKAADCGRSLGDVILNSGEGSGSGHDLGDCTAASITS